MAPHWMARRPAGGGVSWATGLPWRVMTTFSPFSTARISSGRWFLASAMPTSMISNYSHNLWLRKRVAIDFIDLGVDPTGPLGFIPVEAGDSLLSSKRHTSSRGPRSAASELPDRSESACRPISAWHVRYSLYSFYFCLGPSRKILRKLDSWRLTYAPSAPSRDNWFGRVYRDLDCIPLL